MQINFIERTLIAKDKLGKKNAPNAYLTDDGFAMGCAYLLHVLGLNKAFKSLHWFATIHTKFKTDIAKVQKQHANPSQYPDDEEEAN
jgi:WASH complex subunit 7